MKNLWSVDPSHSQITFKAKHMMIANVTGTLAGYDVDVETEGDDFTNANIRFTGKAATISTNNDQRDAHLVSAEFFDVENFPDITFVSTSMEKTANNHFKLSGTLAIRRIEKKVELDVEFGGIQKDPWGNIKAGFTVTGKINRHDFGLNWNTVLETGGVMVSEEVKIVCEIELVKS